MNGVHIAVQRKAFDGSDVIANLNLAISGSEFVAVVGPSGCGKTMLLRLLAGLDNTFEGDMSVPDSPPGFVFQSPRLLPWMTALQNVSLMVKDDVTRATRWLEEVGLAEAALRLPRQLPGGMQRRVALARAFASEPALLLLDEPFVSLDQPTASDLRGLLAALCERTQPTVVMVTHDVHEAITERPGWFLCRSPANVVYDLRVTLPRPRTLEAVQGLWVELQQEHPNLLRGELGRD